MRGLFHDDEPEDPPLFVDEATPFFRKSSPPFLYLFPTLFELTCEFPMELFGVLDVDPPFPFFWLDTLSDE